MTSLGNTFKCFLVICVLQGMKLDSALPWELLVAQLPAKQPPQSSLSVWALSMCVSNVFRTKGCGRTKAG